MFATQGLSAMQLILPEPPSANRWWRNVNGRMVTSRAAREYKDEVLAACINRLGRGWRRAAVVGPVAVRVHWYRGRKAGDLDKRLGVLLDALQGIAFESDAQVIELHAYRYEKDSMGPRVIVQIEPRPVARGGATGNFRTAQGRFT